MRVARRIDAGAVIWAGVAAGIAATAVQIMLWAAFSDAFPGILYRDARLTAAIVLGPKVLPPPTTFEAGIFLVAAAVHFVLSILYTAILAMLVSVSGRAVSLLIGALFGVVLFAINLYGFTAVFPWFIVARDWITLAAHVVFGLVAAAVYKGRPLR
jgi:hypothetical protein